MSERIIRKATRAEGGYWVELEVTEAYTDGKSRIDRVWIPRDEFRNKTREERMQAVQDAVSESPLGEIQGEPVAVPTQTKEVWDDRCVALYERWQRWKVTRIEAQARSMPVAVVNALLAREDALWSEYVQALNQWRLA